MARRRHSPDEIIEKLMAADRLIAGGNSTEAICRELSVSEATYHRWRAQFGGLKAQDAKQLRFLEHENNALRTQLADSEMRIRALTEVARGKY